MLGIWRLMWLENLRANDYDEHTLMTMKHGGCDDTGLDCQYHPRKKKEIGEVFDAIMDTLCFKRLTNYPRIVDYAYQLTFWYFVVLFFWTIIIGPPHFLEGSHDMRSIK